jgi:hypothetical protein
VVAAVVGRAAVVARAGVGVDERCVRVWLSAGVCCLG